jgi:hypothetical protein
MDQSSEERAAQAPEAQAPEAQAANWQVAAMPATGRPAQDAEPQPLPPAPSAPPVANAAAATATADPVPGVAPIPDGTEAGPDIDEVEIMEEEPDMLLYMGDDLAQPAAEAEPAAGRVVVPGPSDRKGARGSKTSAPRRQPDAK